MALTYLGRNDEAIADFTKAIYYSPKLVTAFLARADVHLSRGDNANAAADYRRALAADRNLLTNYPSVAGKLACEIASNNDPTLNCTQRVASVT